MNKADFITGVILCILSTLFIIGALRMPIDPAFGIYGHPGLSPIFFASILFIFSFYLILRSKISLKDIKKDLTFWKRLRGRNDLKNLLITLFFIIIYIFLLRKLPFFILTFFFIFIFSYTFYKKRPLLLFIISLLSTLVIVTIFSKIFLIPMP